MKTFSSAKELREMRNLATVKLEVAARAAKVSLGCMWNFENGKAAPDEKQLAALTALYLKNIEQRDKRMRSLTLYQRFRMEQLCKVLVRRSA